MSNRTYTNGCLPSPPLGRVSNDIIKHVPLTHTSSHLLHLSTYMPLHSPSVTLTVSCPPSPPMLPHSSCQLPSGRNHFTDNCLAPSTRNLHSSFITISLASSPSHSKVLQSIKHANVCHSYRTQYYRLNKSLVAIK